MNGFNKLAFVETRLFLREKAATLAVFALPLALVLGFGLIPGFGKPQKGLSDQIGTEYIAAIGVAIVLATLGLNGVPMVIAQYRERGILRRLAVTPIRPLTLLIAKLAVWAVAAVLSVALVVAVVRFAFHVPVPAASGWFVASSRAESAFNGRNRRFGGTLEFYFFLRFSLRNSASQRCIGFTCL